MGIKGRLATFYNFILLVCLIQNSVQQYKCIAVVEYRPKPNESQLNPKERLDANVKNYIEIIRNLSAATSLMLIVFPESTLEARQGEEPKEFGTKVTLGDNACDSKDRDYADFFRQLSCAAKNYKVAIILNLIQREQYHYYSTDVGLAFDGTTGYNNKKEDRLGEPDLHHTALPFEVPAAKDFTLTEINITKAGQITIVKNEMVFSPTSLLTGFTFSFEKMISKTGYRTYLICSNWISQLPFLTSLQTHQMWAQEFNITMLFSGTNNLEHGQGGTGIYHNTLGPLVMDISVEGTKVYLYNFSNIEEPGTISNPPPVKDIDTLSVEMDQLKTYKDPDLRRYKSVILNPSSGSVDVEVCYDRPSNYFCCQFYVNISTNNSVQSKNVYTYHLVAYKGNKTYHSIFFPGGVEVCAVIACKDHEVSSCGERFENYTDIGWPLTFLELRIRATFAVFHKERIYYSSQFPNSLLSSMRPIHPNFTEWTKRQFYDNAAKGQRLERIFALKKPQDRILTFAIFGRNFSLRDRKRYARRNTGDVFLLSSSLLIVSNICILYYT